MYTMCKNMFWGFFSLKCSVLALQSDIMDVNQIFKDLGMLVHEQGEVIGTCKLTLLI